MTMSERPIRILKEPGHGQHVPPLSDAAAVELLRDARRIAVVGASPMPWRASNSVMGWGTMTPQPGPGTDAYPATISWSSAGE